MEDTVIKRACIIDDDKLYVSLIRMLIKKNRLAEDLLIFENGQDAFEFFKEELTKKEVKEIETPKEENPEEEL